MNNKIENFREELITLLKKYDDNNFVHKILEKVRNNDNSIEEQFKEFDNIFHYTMELKTMKHNIDPNDIYVDINKDYNKIKVVYKIINSAGNTTEVTKIIELDKPIKKNSLIAIRDIDTITLQAYYIDDYDSDNKVIDHEEVKHYNK